MVEAEVHHERPAFAGVVREFEMQQVFRDFLGKRDAHETQRFRQAVGVIVRMVMAEQGWVPTGKKGSLGQRAPTVPRTTKPGAYSNTSGLSDWFTRTEHYNKPDTPGGSTPPPSATRRARKRSRTTVKTAFSTLKRGDVVSDSQGQHFVVDRVQRRAHGRPADVVVLTLPGAVGGRWLVRAADFGDYEVLDT